MSVNDVNISDYSGNLATAIAALSGNAGRVFVDQTTSYQNAAVTIPQDVQVIGEGQRITAITFSGTNGLTLGGDRAVLLGVKVAGTEGTGIGLTIADSVSEAYVEDVWLLDWQDGIKFGNNWNNWLKRIQITDATRYGIHFTENSNANVIEKFAIGTNVGTTMEYAIYLDAGTSHHGPFFRDGRIESINRVIYDATGGTAYSLLMQNIYMEDIVTLTDPVYLNSQCQEIDHCFLNPGPQTGTSIIGVHSKNCRVMSSRLRNSARGITEYLPTLQRDEQPKLRWKSNVFDTDVTEEFDREYE